jgi:hypothetical protein
MTTIIVRWAEPDIMVRVRSLLMGAAAEAIHDAGMCDNLAQLVEMTDKNPALLAMPMVGLSPTETAVWRRVKATANPDLLAGAYE